MKYISLIKIPFLISMLIGCSPASLPPSDLSAEDLSKLEKQFESKFNLTELQIKIANCQNDQVCAVKITYELYDSLFASAGFSQIKTYINYSRWAENLASGEINDMRTLRLYNKWSQAFMGLAACFSKEECRSWLINEKGVDKDDMDKISQSSEQSNKGNGLDMQLF